MLSGSEQDLLTVDPAVDRQLFEALPVAATLVDADGIIVDVNAAFIERARELGFEVSREDRIGRPVLDFATRKEGRELIRGLLDDALAGRPSVRRRHEALSRSGRWRWDLVSARAIAGPAGGVSGVIILREDVTAQVLAERRQQALSDLRRLLHESTSGVDVLVAALFEGLSRCGLRLNACTLSGDDVNVDGARAFRATAGGVEVVEPPADPVGDDARQLTLPLLRGRVELLPGEAVELSEAEVGFATELVSVLSEGLELRRLHRAVEVRNEQLSGEIARREQAQRQFAREVGIRDAIGAVRLCVNSIEAPEDFREILRVVDAGLRSLGVRHDAVSVQIVNAAGDDFLCLALRDGLFHLDELRDVQSLDWRPRADKAREFPWVFEVWRSGRTRYEPCSPDGGALRAGQAVIDAPFSHGTLGVSCRRSNAFSDADLVVVEQLAAALSLGIPRFLERVGADLDAGQQKAVARRRAVVARVREAVWSMRDSGDIDSVAGVLARGLASLEIPFSVCSINFVDDAAGVSPVRSHGVDCDGNTIRVEDSPDAEGAALVRSFWRNGVAVYRPDLRRHDPYSEARRVAELFDRPVRCIVDVPFSQGTLSVNSPEANAFTATDRILLQDLARVLEDAFRRADDLRALESRNRELEALIAERAAAEQRLRQEWTVKAAESAVRMRIASMERPDDLARVVQVISRRLRELGLPLDSCTVQIVNAEGTDFLSVGAATGRHVDTPGMNRLVRLGLDWRGEGDNARRYPWVIDLWRQGGTRYVPDEDASNRMPWRSLLEVAFTRGTLAVNSRRRDAFDDEHIRLLQRFAGLLSEGFQRFVDLLQGQRAERRLRNSERRFRLLAENARDIVFGFRLATPRGFDYLSPAVEAITGHAPASFYDQADLVLRITHADDRPRLRRWLTDTHDSALVIRCEHREGGSVWLELRATPVRRRDGSVVALQGIARDVTAQRRRDVLTEVRLAIRERVWGMSQEGDIDDVLAAVRDGLQRLGVACDQISLHVVDGGGNRVVSYDLADPQTGGVVTGGDSASLLTALWSARRVSYRRDLTRHDPLDEGALLSLDVDAPVRSVLDLPFASGVLRLCSRHAAAFSDEDVRFLGELAEAMSDGFLRMDDLREIRTSESRYRALVETPDLLVLLLDPDGACLYVSPHLATFTGVPAPQLCAEPDALTRLVHPEDVDAQRRLLAAGAGSCEVRWRTPAGVRWVALSAYPLPGEADDDAELVQIVGRDVTEQRRGIALQREIAERLVDAQEQERRRVSRELHDGVNQILSGASAFLDAGTADYGSGGDGRAELTTSREYLDQAMAEVQRISRDLRPAVLDDLGLIPAVRSLSRQVRERSGLQISLSSDLRRPLSKGHETTLFRIVQEALHNVERHAGAQRVEVRIEASHGAVSATGGDDGCGFDTGAPRTGQGLRNIGERVSLIGGRVQVDAGPGLGTRLTVTLPRPREDAPGE